MNDLQKVFPHEDGMKFLEYVQAASSATNLSVEYLLQEYFGAHLLFCLSRSGWKPILKGSAALVWLRRTKHRQPKSIDISLDPSLGDTRYIYILSSSFYFIFIS